MKNLAAVIVLSYLAGALPFSYLAGKLLKGIDIRSYGSRNSGTANTVRVLGLKAGIAVLLLDFMKGFLSVMFIAELDIFSDSMLPLPYLRLAAFASAVIGHIYPVYIRFMGGKGVAAAAGCASALYPLALPLCGTVFAAVFMKTRTVSAASLSAVWTLSLSYPLLSIFFPPFNYSHELLFITASLLISFRHRENIKRLFSKTESKINFDNN